MKPKISIVIPAFNEEKYITGVFEGLKAQSFRNFEVIVVDGGSTDKTRKIARKNGGRVIDERKGSIGGARNEGAKLARGDLIMFTNSDTRASRDVLNTYVELFKDKNVVAASGPLVPLEKTTWFMKFCYHFASVDLAKMSFATGKPAISGSNFMVRKSAFRQCGGFDESLITYEDLDLAHRLSKMGQVRYVRSAVVATSIRRIVKWGYLKYIMFNTGNVVRYNLFHKAKENYEPIR